MLLNHKSSKSQSLLLTCHRYHLHYYNYRPLAYRYIIIVVVVINCFGFKFGLSIARSTNFNHQFHGQLTYLNRSGFFPDCPINVNWVAMRIKRVGTKRTVDRENCLKEISLDQQRYCYGSLLLRQR